MFDLLRQTAEQNRLVLRFGTNRLRHTGHRILDFFGLSALYFLRRATASGVRSFTLLRYIVRYSRGSPVTGWVSSFIREIPY